MLAALQAADATAWLAVAAVASVAWLIWRGGGGTALQALKLANEILEKRVHTLEGQAAIDQKMLAELRARTDITEAIQPLIEAVLQHEEAATARYEKTGLVLDTIASRLGAEPTAHE